MITTADLQSAWDEIDRIRGDAGLSIPDERPRGWVSVREYADRFNLDLQAAERELKILVASGKLRRAQFRQIGTDGRRRATWCYGV